MEEQKHLLGTFVFDGTMVFLLKDIGDFEVKSSVSRSAILSNSV
jgi:hypothetical protein